MAIVKHNDGLRVGRRGLLGAAGVLIVLLAWQLTIAAGLIDSHDVPSATTVGSELVRQAQIAPFWDAVGRTMEAWALGMALSIAIAVPLGMLIGASDAVWHALRPTLELLRPVPGVALIPLAVLLFGEGVESDVALIVFGTFWLLLIQAMYGVREVDAIASRTARAYGLGRAARIRWLVLPSASAYIATGVRIASAIGLVVAVTAELVIGNPGLGSAIAKAQGGGAIDRMYALILASGLLGVAIQSSFGALERRTLHWHQSQRPRTGDA